MYFTPFAKSLSRVPLPSIAGYKSPCPGGHHSWLGSADQVAGASPSASTLGALFWTNSRSSPVPRAVYLERAASVSSEVEKEFISMNLRSGMAYLDFMNSTCLAMRSKKVLPSETVNSDFAFSRPMPVPSPPFNFKMTVSFNSSGLGVTVKVSRSGKVGTASNADSGIIVLAPEVRTLKLYLNALIAASEELSFPPAFILAS
mmetsp:Transcript_24815/g.57274  ORF Transcript_24815/g.57274 Transcript_24815/m.57274 type:complete len:202 (-) Transcript_24815:116-721(-)